MEVAINTPQEVQERERSRNCIRFPVIFRVIRVDFFAVLDCMVALTGIHNQTSIDITQRVATF